MKCLKLIIENDGVLVNMYEIDEKIVNAFE